MEKITSIINRLKNDPRYANKNELVKVYKNCVKYQVYGLNNCSELIKVVREICYGNESDRIINFEYERTFTPSFWVAVEK